MIYGIILMDRRKGPTWFHDSILPGIIPDHVFDLMVDRFVEEEIGLCDKCDVQGTRCHVIEEPSGRKLCPVLFADVVRPPWTVDQVLGSEPLKGAA